MKIKKLSLIWTHVHCTSMVDEVSVAPPEYEDTVILVVKKGDSPPVLFGRIYGHVLSDKKFIVGCRYRKNGAWNIYVKTENESPSYFENYSDKESFDPLLKVCFYGVGALGKQYFLAAKCVNGKPVVCSMTWERQAGQQSLFFLADEFRNFGINLSDLISSISLPKGGDIDE